MITTQSYKNRDKVLHYLEKIKFDFQKEGILIVGLFGSVARNKSDLFSDIDIAIKLQDDYLKSRSVWDYFDQINKIKNLISKKFNCKCDIFDLDSDSFIKETVLKELIYV